MPRYAHAQFRWSEQGQTYVLFLNDQASTQTLTSDWLEHASSFSFHSRSGMHYTVRKQRVQRGSSYWYAYRRLHGRIVKRYLGRTAELTLARLEEIACLLESMSDSRQNSLPSDQTTALSHPALHSSHAENDAAHATVVAFPLLLSKLSPPRLHTLLLDRPRLFALLDAGREYPLTLLSAPTGFGKTTLVCQWMTARRASHDFPPVAWVSLEAADNDPVRFWRYLVAACQEFQTDLAQAQSALTALNPQPPFVPSSLEAMLTILLNALARCLAGGILILEDYHVITERSIHETVAFFLDHLPTTIHLIIITRSDPPFSLARLRARNILCEVRTADLRFSQEETAILLQQVLSFPLDASTIQRLHTQLEGWGGGLHLVKLALQRAATQESGEQQLALFSGSNASLQEYFVTEVLDPLPEVVQQFLLQTSILTRLTASLCDAVTEQQNSQDMLALLERANLFLEPLGTAGQWYRYHALFAEAMRSEARRRFGEDQLHYLSARASHWYEEHGYHGEAIDAALDAQDYRRGATLIEQSIEERALPGEIQEPHTLHRWLEQFPETLLEQYPVLSLSYATTLLFMSDSWQPDALTLRSLEKLLQNAEHRFRVENRLSKLGELMAFRALLAIRQGATPDALAHAKQALDWLPQISTTARKNPNIWRGVCLSIVAEEWIQTGQFPRARGILQEALTLCAITGNAYFKHIALTKLARVYFEQGEFHQASALYRQALTGARETGHLYVHCDALTHLTALCYERNELAEAADYAEETIAISQRQLLVFYEVHATLLLARVKLAQGETFVAQQLLTTLLDTLPVTLPRLAELVQAAQARIALASNESMTVQRWATTRLPQSDFTREVEETLLLARWSRVQGRLDAAAQQLEGLLDTAREAGHTRGVLEILIEMALLAATRQSKGEAHALLREALSQALTMQALRPFLDAGEPMARLLRMLLPLLHDSQPVQAFTRALLTAFPVTEMQEQSSSLLLEPLSPQEMRVLRLLVQHRSNAEIARELVVSVNTVRTQVQSIYRKLGVNKRSAASDMARALRLIS